MMAIDTKLKNDIRREKIQIYDAAARKRDACVRQDDGLLVAYPEYRQMHRRGRRSVRRS